MLRKRSFFMTVFALLTMLLCVPSGSAIYQGHHPGLQLRIMETTDLHSYIMNYEYKTGKKVKSFGFVKTVSLIKKARSEKANTLLFDNGDLIQGSALGDYIHEHPGQLHPIISIMNELQYDAAAPGNHEFNYGLGYLNKKLKEAAFPYVNSNLFIQGTESFQEELPYFSPYVILHRIFTGDDGRKYPVKIGVIGFITPVVLKWDAEHLKGKLINKSIVESAEHYIPIMREKGADVVIALAHAGLEADEQVKDKSLNSVLGLSKVPGIDAIMYGHTHQVFPSPKPWHGSRLVDMEAGTINGIPAVQAGSWGSHLGIIDLNLALKEGKWKVVSTDTDVRPVFLPGAPGLSGGIENDQRAKQLAEDVHLKAKKHK
ncbi:metallophosphoesterase [Bacillus infantis]|uniref:metallophosphoesterase n=1 Tax=Bacillus infantis TaxID=324767 RepID=UPI001CD5A53B|nr:metallophosphoesterase [Bacillus infantis]MCA1038176.1 metallophosphoesterase [Bacillus infantis]